MGRQEIVCDLSSSLERHFKVDLFFSWNGEVGRVVIFDLSQYTNSVHILKHAWTVFALCWRPCLALLLSVILTAFLERGRDVVWLVRIATLCPPFPLPLKVFARCLGLLRIVTIKIAIIVMIFSVYIYRSISSFLCVGCCCCAAVFVVYGIVLCSARSLKECHYKNSRYC